MKNKKQNIRNNSQMKEDSVDPNQIAAPKMDERDVKQIMENHRDILQREKPQEEEVPEVRARPKKKKPMKNEDRVKMLYFEKYGGKAKASKLGKRRKSKKAMGKRLKSESKAQAKDSLYEPRRVEAQPKGGSIRDKHAQRRLSKDRLKEMRKLSKEKKKGDSRKHQKDYSGIIEQIEQNYESRGKINLSEYYQDGDQSFQKYRPSHIREKVLPPTIGRRHTDLASYREARKQQKLKNKHSREQLVPKTHYSMLEPETGGATQGQDLINMSYQMPGRILEEDEFRGGNINNIQPAEKERPKNKDLISRNKESARKGPKNSGKKAKHVKSRFKKTGNLGGTKNSYTSFMKSGNFEKEFLEEINYKKPRKKKIGGLITSAERSNYQSKVSNLKEDSQMHYQSNLSGKPENHEFGRNSPPQSEGTKPPTGHSQKEMINIYRNDPPQPLWRREPTKGSGDQLPSNSDIQRVSMMEKDSEFYEYSEINSVAQDLSKQSTAL